MFRQLFFLISFLAASVFFHSNAIAAACNQTVLDNMRSKAKTEFDGDVSIFNHVRDFSAAVPSVLSWACFESIKPDSSLFSFSSGSMNSTLGAVTGSVGGYLNGPGNPLGATCSDSRSALTTNYDLQKGKIETALNTASLLYPTMQTFPVVTSSFPRINPATACAGAPIATGIAGYTFCPNPGCYPDYPVAGPPTCKAASS